MSSNRPWRHRLAGLALAGLTALGAVATTLLVGPPSSWPLPAAAGAPQAAHPVPDGVRQAPALPGGQPVSEADRVYTADQTSNTVTVIAPATNEVLGTLPLGDPRLDGVLGPVDTDQVNVHGLGFSPDGRRLAVVSVTSNAVQIVDTATNAVVSTTYLGRAPHEAFISPDGRTVWTAVRGEDYVSVVDLDTGVESRRIATADGPSKVVFGPDGRTAYVNHLRAAELTVIDVPSRRVRDRIPLSVTGSADLAASPDGDEVWLGHPGAGKTTVVDAVAGSEKAMLDTGPRTNHPNFVTTADGAFAWVTVGGLDEIKLYRRSAGRPELVDTIATSGKSPHGIWPSPDSSRVYVALQKSDAVDVIDTATREVVATLPVGQDPQALVYVARTEPGARDGLSAQGLDQPIRTMPLTTDIPGASGAATVRAVLGLDEIDVTASGLTPATAYDVYATAAGRRAKLLTTTSNDTGTIEEALAFVEFFDSGYDRIVLVPAGGPP